MSFHKDMSLGIWKEAMLGKNIILAEHDCSIREIAEASITRWKAENRIRGSN